MNTLDGAAVDAVARLAQKAAANHDPIKIGEDYYAEQRNQLQRIRRLAPTPEPLRVSTLTSFVDFLERNDTGGAGGAAAERYVHVVSPTEVRLISSLVGVELQRHVFAIATPVLPASLESVFSPEEFIIALHTRCVQSEDRDYLIALASDVRAGSEVAASDDGLSQTISGKSGVTLMRAQTVKNPVHLAPYRTFPEVSQPASAFIVRAKKGSGEGSPVNFTLIEADGGAWRLEAVNAIARWLDEHGVELPVLV